MGGGHEEAALLHGTHPATVVAPMPKCWAGGALGQQTLSLPVICTIAGKVMKGLLWDWIKYIGHQDHHD